MGTPNRLRQVKHAISVSSLLNSTDSHSTESEQKVPELNPTLLTVTLLREELAAANARAEQADKALQTATADLEDETEMNRSHLDKIRELEEHIAELSSRK